MQKKRLTARDLYARCCGEGGMSPEYFMHSLTFYEAEAYVEGVNRKARSSWEQTRFLISSFGGQKAYDSIHFDWDDENEQNDMPSEDDVLHLKELMRKEQERIKNNG